MPGPYDENWRRYLALRKRYGGILAGFFPFVILLTVFWQLAFGERWFPTFCAILGGYIVWMFYVGNRVAAWRCPRCGKRFAGTWWYNAGFFAQNCVHCGLAKFAFKDE